MSVGSEGKHTPGPWAVIPPNREHPSRAMVGGGGCNIYDAPLTTETAANARLIAAAPELLAALEPFAKFACDPPCECHNCIARAAVAKAKGLTP